GCVKVFHVDGFKYSVVIAEGVLGNDKIFENNGIAHFDLSKPSLPQDGFG
ncbi:hypothetical protein CCACVL1_14686, partial [Corchorus capsularis]